MLALSVQVPLRMGVFSFAGAGSFGIGAYSAAELVVHTGILGALVAIAVSVLLTAVVGLLLGLAHLPAQGLYLAMATVAFDLIIGVLAINGGDFTGSSTGLYGSARRLRDDRDVPAHFVALFLVALSEHGKHRPAGARGA